MKASCYKLQCQTLQKTSAGLFTERKLSQLTVVSNLRNRRRTCRMPGYFRSLIGDDRFRRAYVLLRLDKSFRICPCPPCSAQIDGSAETWPSGRRRSPAKGVGPEGSRGFESLRLRHQPRFLTYLRYLGLVGWMLGADASPSWISTTLYREYMWRCPEGRYIPELS